MTVYNKNMWELNLQILSLKWDFINLICLKRKWYVIHHYSYKFTGFTKHMQVLNVSFQRNILYYKLYSSSIDLLYNCHAQSSFDIFNENNVQIMNSSFKTLASIHIVKYSSNIVTINYWLLFIHVKSQTKTISLL